MNSFHGIARIYNLPGSINVIVPSFRQTRYNPEIAEYLNTVLDQPAPLPFEWNSEWDYDADEPYYF